MDGFLTFTFAQVAQAEAHKALDARQVWRARTVPGPFVPPRAMDLDFLVTIEGDQMATMRRLLQAKGFQTPRDLRNPFHFKLGIRRNPYTRAFFDATLGQGALPACIEVRFSVWQSLVAKVLPSVARDRRAELQNLLEHFMLRSDTMTFNMPELDHAFNT